MYHYAYFNENHVGSKISPTLTDINENDHKLDWNIKN